MIPRHFWISFSVAVCFVLVYQMFSHASPKKEEEAPLTLLELGYIPSDDKKNLSDLTFHVYTPEGNSLKKEEKKISDYAGKFVILHFWATWCGPCVQELPSYDRFAGKAANITNLAVVSDQTSPESIQAFFKNKGISTLQIMKDPNGASARLKISGIPTTLFIDKKGCEMGRIVGPIHWNDLSVVNLILTLLT